MPKYPVLDTEGHVHFLTFSCYKRRRLLDDERAAGIVMHFLASLLEKRQGRCLGFVIMPDHVHSLVWFPKPNQLSDFVKQWKRRTSMELKKHLITARPRYAASFEPDEPIWQARYYGFNIFSEQKLLEKLQYMHNNPVKEGLVVNSSDWPWSSARWYERGLPLGIPIGW
jgi:putative transposase